MADEKVKGTAEDSKVTGPLAGAAPVGGAISRTFAPDAPAKAAIEDQLKNEPAKALGAVKIERVTDAHGKTPEEKTAIEKLLENGPIIRLPYESESPTTEHWDFAPDKDTFEVPAAVAAAAVASEFFRAVE